MNSIKLLPISLPVMTILIAFGMGSRSSSALEDRAARVTGIVTYPQRIALLEDAVVTVQVEDTSLADAPTNVIGEQIISTPEQVPVPYDVCYDPAKIDQRFSYSMRVRITDSKGKLLWINDTHTPVITNGNPGENVEVRVIQVGGKKNRTSSQ